MTDSMWLKLILLVLASLSSVSSWAEQQAGDPGFSDVRVLIDISGSMKKNDPRNLRRPALRLLVGLLPENSRSGVWTFGQYVNMQIPLGLVDKAWKRRARAEAAKIGSPGQFTNIEEAIARSIGDWDQPTDRYRRHLVLLTDGMVDISKDPKQSAASRQRILDELLPKLKSAGTQVHTIALSDRADHELMHALAQGTGGRYVQVDSADELQRIFLHLFEKVSQPDTLPLKDNKFQVDKSIEEMTLLVFRQVDSKATRVVTPSGSSFSAEEAPADVNWHRDEGYDLLTISHPEVGEWSIQAALDPDNRVVVVTHLKMRVSELPSRLILGENFPMSIDFSEEKERITEPKFLQLVQLQAYANDANGVGESRPIQDNGVTPDKRANDGEFSLNIGEGMAPGEVEFVVNAEGTTFQRERRQRFTLVPPVVVNQVEQKQGEDNGVMVTLKPAADLIDMASFQSQGSLVSRDGKELAAMFLPSDDGSSFETWINLSQLPEGEWTLGINIQARTRDGHDLVLDLDPISVIGQRSPEAVQKVVAEEIPKTEEPKSKEGYGLKEYSIIFGVLNLLILLIIAAVIWWIKRRGNTSIDLVEGKELSDGEIVAQGGREVSADQDVKTQKEEGETGPETQSPAGETTTEKVSVTSDPIEEILFESDAEAEAVLVEDEDKGK